jgi:hypothetical protein
MRRRLIRWFRRLIEHGQLIEHWQLIEHRQLIDHWQLIEHGQLIEHRRVNAGAAESCFRPVHAFGRRDGFPRPRL